MGLNSREGWVTAWQLRQTSLLFRCSVAVIPLFLLLLSRCSVAVFEALNYGKMLVDPKHYESAAWFFVEKQRMPAPSSPSPDCTRVGVLVPRGRLLTRPVHARAEAAIPAWRRATPIYCGAAGIHRRSDVTKDMTQPSGERK